MTHPREEFRQIDRHVGKRLKQLRMQRGQTQIDVAGVLDRTFQQVQKYENGRNRISASVLYTLAKHFEIPVESFFDGLSA